MRFAVAEALRAHDLALAARERHRRPPLPPEVERCGTEQAALRHRWRLADGRRAAYVGALELVQENTTLRVARTSISRRPGDLLFFDQGDDQHLMVWTGWYVAYHTGTSERARQRPARRGAVATS